METQEQQGVVTFPSGAASSRIPRYDLIPRKALIRLAGRFELGLEVHRERAWNGRSTNQHALTDREWVVARIGHVIDHAYKLLDKLEGRLPDDNDDDASAIAWAGIFLCEATDALKAKTAMTQDDTGPGWA